MEADPQNIEARFRLAEALRWVGLAETSSEETAAVEREAIGEYQKIWKDRATLASGLAADVGVGYGFALANLAQTIRETNLANLGDGKTAEDHAAWVLEILALAAEKDDVNATMIESRRGQRRFDLCRRLVPHELLRMGDRLPERPCERGIRRRTGHASAMSPPPIPTIRYAERRAWKP